MRGGGSGRADGSGARRRSAALGLTARRAGIRVTRGKGRKEGEGGYVGGADTPRNVSTLTILVMGKGGVGKSSTVNSIAVERVATVSAFQSESMMCSRTRAGFTLNIIDTPGLIEGGYINEQAVDIIKRFKDAVG
ncbi:hypothetical protein ABZP36_020995 [Zizania latifolia]